MDESLVRQYPEIERDHFWWVTRREFVRSLLLSQELGDSPAILDVGCGSGVLAAELSSLGAAVSGVDVVSHSEWESHDAERVDFHVGDYLELSAQLGHFDCVLALDVVEHIEDEGAFLEALWENVRPGGLVIVTVPAYRWLWSRHDEINHHFRRYTKGELIESLRNRRFEVTRCGYLFLSLIGPKLVAKGLERIRPPGDTVSVPSRTLNTAARNYFRWEHKFAAGFRGFLPAGTSVVAICRRPD